MTKTNIFGRGFNLVRSCIFSPALYAQMSERGIGEAARYIVVVSFVLMFLTIAPVWMFILSLKPAMVDTAISYYPDGLEISLKDGELSTNQIEPYAIANPFPGESFENVIVFDTKDDTYTPDSVREAKTLVLAKRTFGIAQDPESLGKQEIFTYGTSTGSITLTKEKIAAVGEKVKPYVRPAAIFGGAFLFVLIVLIAGVCILGIQLVYAVFPAVFVYIYFKMSKQNESFKTAYVSALFASIPVMLIAAAALMFGGLPSYLFTALVVGIVVANRWNVART
jgi:hypothetical protein